MLVSDFYVLGVVLYWLFIYISFYGDGIYDGFVLSWVICEYEFIVFSCVVDVI